MLKTMVRQARSVARRIIRPPLHTAEVKLPYRVYGTEYGGWPLLNGTVDQNTIIVSVGLGEDISFDLAVIQRFGCQVHGCDPTPKSLQWLRAQRLPPQFYVHALGLGDKDGPVAVIPPANETHVSFSATRGHDQDGDAIDIDIVTLPTLMRQIGVDRLDVLKMDIEGFEYGVVDALVASSIRPGQLLIEFHHGMYTYQAVDTRRAVDALRSAGYRLFYVSSGGHEYGFVREAMA